MESAPPLMMKSAPRLMIPGLPNDIAILCLLKVPRIYHACLASVCISWRNAVRRPEFYQERRRLGSTDAWLVLVSAEILSTPALLYSAYDLSTRQLLFKVRFPPSLPVDEHTTHVKPPAHGVDSGSISLNVAGNNKALGSISVCDGKCAGGVLPKLNTHLHKLDHYRIAAMNEYFAVLGFTHCSRLCTAICTFTIYNTVTDEWRHTWPLSICREMFACGVINGRLYIAGGQNEKGETERTTEVYDFEADEWGVAEALPEGVGRIEGDVVYQGKLYVQCREAGGEGKCVLWVYNPEEDKWEEEKGGEVGGGQLIATERFMYAMGGEEELYRYEEKRERGGKWKRVGKRRTSKLTAGGMNKGRHEGQVYCRQASQRAFGSGDDIFVLQETSNGTVSLPSDGFTKCHRLLPVKPTWYHAGAVVNT